MDHPKISILMKPMSFPNRIPFLSSLPNEFFEKKKTGRSGNSAKENELELDLEAQQVEVNSLRGVDSLTHPTFNKKEDILIMGIFWTTTSVDVSDIRRSPVEVGRI